MIGLDTNVVVRLFVDDDPKQAELARNLVAGQCSPERPGFIDRVALCELLWVLSSAHGYSRSALATVVATLLASRDIRLEDDNLVQLALEDYRATNVDFADILIGHVDIARGCEMTATFDRKAAKLKGFTRVS
jgi:predicted nucleic-acid-binding protein